MVIRASSRSTSRAIFPAALAVTVSLGALSLGACGGASADPVPDAAVIPEPSIAGTWQIQSGDLFALGQGAGLDSIDFIEFNPVSEGARSGSGELFASSAAGLVGCTQLVYAELGTDAVSLSVPALGIPDLRVVEHIDDNTVALTDAFDQRVELVRTEAVPAASQCVEAAVVDETDLPASLASFTGLVNDGTFLWYEGSNNTWIPYDPTAGQFASPIAVPGAAGQFTHIHASQGSDFWTHCGCGGSQEAKLVRSTDGAQLNIVNTSNTVGGPTPDANEIGVRGIAFDGTDLILAGNARDGSGFKILKVDLSTGPDPHTVTVLRPEFSAGNLGLRGAEIWTQSNALGTTIVRFDPVNGNVLETIKMPSGLFIRAFTFFGDRIFALASTGAEDKLFELSVP